MPSRDMLQVNEQEPECHSWPPARFVRPGRDGHRPGWTTCSVVARARLRKAFLGASEDLIRNFHGVAPVAEPDEDEIRYLAGGVAEIKRQK